MLAFLLLSAKPQLHSTSIQNDFDCLHACEQVNQQLNLSHRSNQPHLFPPLIQTRHASIDLLSFVGKKEKHANVSRTFPIVYRWNGVVMF